MSILRLAIGFGERLSCGESAAFVELEVLRVIVSEDRSVWPFDVIIMMPHLINDSSTNLPKSPPNSFHTAKLNTARV